MELEPSLALSFFFGLGVVARSLLMLDSRSIRKNMAGIGVSLLMVPLTFLIGMAKIPDWSPYLHLFIALAVYCMTFALIMK